MRLRMILCSCLLLAMPATAHAAPIPDSTTAAARAREARGWFADGQYGPLWSAMTPEFRSAMRDSASFSAMTAMLRAQTGAVDSVLDFKVAPASGGWSTSERLRFESAPGVLVFRLQFDADGRIAGMVLRPEQAPPREHPSAHLDYVTRTALRLPFRGEWFVFWGGRTRDLNHHTGIRAQRFAMDLIIQREGRSHRGDGRALTDYYAYGEPILAPAAGTVVWREDGHRDQPIGSTDAKSPIGNGLILDHGNGEFSLFAHFQPGSMPFQLGDQVREGAVIGRCGNSGNTSEPHLHYHLQNGPDPVASDGLPVFFADFEADGRRVERGELQRGQQVRRRR